MQKKPVFTFLIICLESISVVVLFITAFGIYGFLQYQNRGADLLQDSSWLHFPGATVTAGGIHFKPLDRMIVHQDGSAGQQNPPINISGQHLLVKGDFKITAIFSQIDKRASLRLYANPPIIYDQWRYETPSIDITLDVKNNTLAMRVWDGTSSNSMDMREYTVPFISPVTISLEHIKDQFTLTENNHLLGSMPDHHIFNSGAIWFGADGVPGSKGWTLSALDAKASGVGSVKLAPAALMMIDQSDTTSLRNLADARSWKIKIGAAINTNALFADQQYRSLALGQFNIITPENDMKPEFIHPAPDAYDFAQADQLVDIAAKNTIAVHGHALLYDKSSPDWMVKSLKENRQGIMLSHITTVVGHFKERVAEWDVVNEPLSDKHALYENGGTGLEQNIWFEAMGEQYIDLAFKTARQADPAAKLYINDYGLENDGQRWDALLSLVKRLQQRGTPIDGVGFEAHVYGDGDYINAGQLKKHMEILNGLGLLTRISEIDVTGDDPREQINQYATALDVCLRAPNCTSYTTWGITDKYGSTTRSDRYPSIYGTSLLWDKDMKPKPAYDALQKRLQQN